MGGDSIRVRVNIDHPVSNWELLMPGGRNAWGRCRFDINPEPGGTADFAVTLWNARALDRFSCARENTLFIAGEPLDKKRYPDGFYRQFGHVVDSHGQSHHPGLHVDALGLNWHVGLEYPAYRYRYGYDYLAALSAPTKENRVSVVCSNANKTEGQRRRLELLEGLKQRLGDRIVHYGRGFEPIEDKMDAILPYRFHLVLENGIQPNYWTEKLADAYLGWAFPVYLGCPNINEYLPPESLVPIEGMDVDDIATLIELLLASPLDDSRVKAVAQAREQILNRYNPFAWAAHWVEQLYQPQLKAEEITLRSHKAFRSFPRGLAFRLRQRMRNS